MNGRNVTLHEVERDSWNRRQRPMGEDPARGVAVVRVPLLRMIEQTLVIEHPLVGRRAHRHRADIAEEAHEVLFSRRPLDLEEPVKRGVVVGYVAVEARRCVVLRFRHTCNSARHLRRQATCLGPLPFRQSRGR